LFILLSFLFLWNISILNISELDILDINFKNISIKFNYLIFFLLFFIFNKKQNYEYFFQQRKIIILCLFIIIHYLINSFYDNKFEIKNIFIILSIPLLGFIYSNYRNFLIENFKKILIIFFILFIFFSIYENPKYNIGSCNADYFLITLLKDKFNITFSNSIFAENSHLAMMMVPVIISSIFIHLNEKKKSFLFLLCLIVSIIISILNFSTTFYISYFISIIVLFIFFFKKIFFKFYLSSFIFLIFISIFFFKDTNCKKKITDFNVQDIFEQKVQKGNKNLTTVIYERSAIISFRTLQYRPFGWGLNGMKKANENLIKEYGYIKPYEVSLLNIEDGLNNFFKIITEFGFFSVIIAYQFFKYILSLKKINEFNIFIIILFLTLCIRGAGYFNAGFIFCIFEFFYFFHRKEKIKTQI